MSKTKTVKPTPDSPSTLQEHDAAAKNGTAGLKPELEATFSQAMQEGICLTCIHQSKCLFLKAASQPIMFCDEFDSQENATADADVAVDVLVYGRS